MRIISNVKAVSTFILIILILCSAVLGAFISYLLVMSNYYNMPENTTLLIVENVTFPIFDATYFNVTILNPSNSASDVNITAIHLSVEGENEIYNFTTTVPERLPFLIRRGTRQTFKCEENWSNFAGETVRIEPLAENASTKSYSCTTPKVKLLTTFFDVSQSVEFFILTIENSLESIINLTISEIKVFSPLINVTPSLPYILSPGQMEIFQCDWNWENYGNVTITVRTAEGYESVYITNELPNAIIYIDEVKFNYTDTTYFDLTVKSSEYSTANAIIKRVNLTLSDERTITLNTTPPLHVMPISVPPNESLPIRCHWDWNTHRNETITVSVYTKQGFTVYNKTARTPSAIVWNITDVKFDLDDLQHFLVNVTNILCSLQDINVTKIEFDQHPTNMNSSIIARGEQVTFTCEWNWTDSVGKNAAITVYTEDEISISYNLTLPYLKIKEVSFSRFSIGNPYINITIYDSSFSTINATLTQIFIETENGTYTIDGTITEPKVSPNGYELSTGANVTIVCPWHWNPHLGKNVTVIVQTAEGAHVSKTVQVESATP